MSAHGITACGFNHEFPPCPRSYLYPQPNGAALYPPHREDDLILHAPGVCRECDFYPLWQARRVQYKVNFTGNDVPGFQPDPYLLRMSYPRVVRRPRPMQVPLPVGVPERPSMLAKIKRALRRW